MLSGIIHINIHVSIYFFHTNKDQAFSCRMLHFLYRCDKKSQIRSDLKMPGEIAFCHRWELHACKAIVCVLRLFSFGIQIEVP